MSRSPPASESSQMSTIVMTNCQENVNKMLAVTPLSPEKDEEQRISALREALPQILATCAKNMLLLNIGMTLAFPTVVIGALLRAKIGEGDPYGLAFDEEQASWFAGVMLICQPFGSVLSGALLEPLGRKRAMLLVNAPCLLGWVLMASAKSHPVLLGASALMGLSMGFMEAPIITYVGEISTPRLRGALTSMAGISVMLGFVIEFLLGTLVPWRTAAWGSSAVPLVTLLAISQVPESPVWLAAKRRVQDAERALCWLRGWVQPQLVHKELTRLVSYTQEMKRVEACQDEQTMGAEGLQADGSASKANAEPLFTISKNTPNGMALKQGEINQGFVSEKGDDVQELDAQSSGVKAKTLIMDPWLPFRREISLPLLLVVSFFVIHHWTGLSGLRPFMVPVFKEFGLPLDAHWLTVVSALLGLGGNILCTLVVSRSGKRPLALVSIAGVAVAALALGCYHRVVCSACSVGNPAPSDHSWVPLLFFVVLFFFHSFGIGPIPWMLLSEVFPYQGRGLATGIAAAMSYVLGFFAAKTFHRIEAALYLSGVFFVYGGVAVAGFIFMWIWLPETEGRSLQEIEAFYSRKSKMNKCNNKVSLGLEATSL